MTDINKKEMLIFGRSQTWPDVIEEIRVTHNGVFGIKLFMGHDGHNVCRFLDYDKVIAVGQSGMSMANAVEQCIEDFNGSRKSTINQKEQPKEDINHPAHYGGDTVYEAIKVIEAWGAGFHLGNSLKYIRRALFMGRNPEQRLKDLKKAAWYLEREVITEQNKAHV